MNIYTKKEVKNQLLHPRKETKGYTRWWWFGCAVDKEEIKRELDYMLEAEIGGVELQILYPICADDTERGIQNQQYLSPGFFTYIKYACEEAKKRGLKFDFTLGSSWPYGGPFVPIELSAPNVIPYTIDVKGPCQYSYDFTTRLYGECVACVMGEMEDCKMIPETIVDITDKVIDKYLFNWEWGKELTTVEIPEGNYKIVIFLSSDKRQTVLKPLPNGDGLIIDHNRKDAVRLFLEHGGDPIAEQLGEGMVQSYFCDSIEVFGQNWTDIVYEEFQKRRGYELRPFVYALWGEVKDMTDLIRYDFQKTLGELTVENFFQEVTKWCHEKGTTSRMQAHGTWGDVLLAYGAADIPEGETFSEFDRYEVNTIHRKLASSAAHVYGKTIISNESFTWLRFPRFTVTLENIKAAADSIFLDGMNQIVNHGYAYSPEDSGELGWPFYASSQINHKNTWWPYYKYVSVYMNRVCDFLRRGKTKINLAIYLPQADIWAENPLSDIHMCMKLEERMTTEIVDGIHKAGFWFDYVNDEVLTHWQDYEYEGLMLLECDRITIETARNIEAFATSGRAVICKGHVPRRSCGLLEYEENTKGINEIFGELVDKNLCKVTADTLQDVTEILGKYISRDVIFEYHKETIGYVHQVEDEKDIYFISNISNEKKKERITFFNQIKHFVAMDPMTAMEKELLCVTQDGKNTIIDLDMEPYQSIIFVFTPQMMDEYKVVKPVKEINFLDVSENWEFSVPNKGFQKKYQRLNGWELEQELKYYSGEGVYQKEFVITQTMQNIIKKSTSMILQLEHIGEVATIYLNDAEVGNLFMKPYKIDITSFLKQGVNTLEIRVKNLLINRAIDPSYPQDDYKEPVITEWPYTTEKLNRGRQERVYNWRERDMIKVPVTSGIWGKIEIKSIEK